MRSINRTIELVGAHQERVSPEVRAQIEEKNADVCKHRMSCYINEYIGSTTDPVTIYGLDENGNITTRQFSTKELQNKGGRRRRV